MIRRPSRRQLLAHTPIGLLGFLGLNTRPASAFAKPLKPLEPSDSASHPADFPKTEIQRVYDTVLFAHSDLAKVKTLVEATPTLANAAMDWGFGDWESALGAASHMGRPDIAEVLLAHGARPDVFTHAMMGHLDAIEAIVRARPGIQRQRGPHGITLLAHATSGGDKATKVVAFLEKLGDADPEQEDEPGMLAISNYVGEYTYGDGNILEVFERRGRLSIKTSNTFPFNLYHLGNHVFHPNGAPSMHLTFQVNRGRVDHLSVADSSMRIDAVRSSEPAD